MRTVVLVSGTGSILKAMIEQDIPIAAVIVDRQCDAIDIATDAGLEVVVVERRDYTSTFDRERYSKLVLEAIEPFAPDLVVLAGFGTVLAGSFVDSFPGRVLNTHPALLPAFKGWHAVGEALRAGVKVTGCTVHVVTAEVDEGPIVAQEAVPVLDGDTEETLHERIKQVERALYPATIKKLLAELQEKGEVT